jgi:hypothetical protein
MTTLCLDDLKVIDKPKKRASNVARCSEPGCQTFQIHKSGKCDPHRTERCQTPECDVHFTWTRQREVYCVDCRNARKRTARRYAFA